MFVTDIVRNTTSDDTVVTGLEMAAVVVILACTLMAAGLWFLTLNAQYAVLLWSTADEVKAASAARRERILKQVRAAGGDGVATPTPVNGVRLAPDHGSNGRAV